MKPAFSHHPEVRDVFPFDTDGYTYLNITVWNDIQISGHYVDTIRVVDGDNVTSLTIGPQALKPDGTFVVEYAVGSVSGTPTVVVSARCTISGYGPTTWTGQIPEVVSLIHLSLLMIGSLVPLLFFKKHRARVLQCA